MWAGSRWPFPVVRDDELHLHAASPEPEREIEPEFVLFLRRHLCFFIFRVVRAQHRAQDLPANIYADAVSLHLNLV